jgi:glycosyltransferase involved in cell wall biosynthesis
MPGLTDKPLISVILHLPKSMPYTKYRFYQTIQRVFDQLDVNIELIILDQLADEKVTEEINRRAAAGDLSVNFIRDPFSTLGAWLNAARARANGSYLLYIDNSAALILLRKAATLLFLLAAEKDQKTGMIYADYEYKTDKKISEVHLLKPHNGRVRDNQDYGRVTFFRKSALTECSGFDESLRFNTLYDIRLKMMENSRVVHIANRYAGSLYQVLGSGKEHNVFDYLLASKESQLEAEEVLTAHLKRTNTYLAPARFYRDRPAEDYSEKLKATVIIPVNNRPGFISTAIESVLAQTEQQIEIIVVVNGGEKDPTNKVVRSFMSGGEKYDPTRPEVRLITLDINNIGFCLNTGVRHARGIYYIQLDSDDRLKPRAVEKIIRLFDSDHRIGMVIGSYEVWEKNEVEGSLFRVVSIPVVTHDEWTEENGRNNLLRINGAGAPRSIPVQLIREIGFFGVNDEPYARNYGEDYEMVLKISEKYKIGRIWEPIYEVVRHKGGTDHRIDITTVDRNDEAKDEMRRQAMERRKKMNDKR